MDKEIKWTPVEPGDHLMTLDDFEECVKIGGFIDYDGFGEFATATHVSDVEVWPSSFDRSKVDPIFTHVCWYNR